MRSNTNKVNGLDVALWTLSDMEAALIEATRHKGIGWMSIWRLAYELRRDLFNEYMNNLIKRKFGCSSKARARFFRSCGVIVERKDWGWQYMGWTP